MLRNIIQLKTICSHPHAGCMLPCIHGCGWKLYSLSASSCPSMGLMLFNSISVSFMNAWEPESELHSWMHGSVVLEKCFDRICGSVPLLRGFWKMLIWGWPCEVENCWCLKEKAQSYYMREGMVPKCDCCSPNNQIQKHFALSNDIVQKMTEDWMFFHLQLCPK